MLPKWCNYLPEPSITLERVRLTTKLHFVKQQNENEGEWKVVSRKGSKRGKKQQNMDQFTRNVRLDKRYEI